MMWPFRKRQTVRSVVVDAREEIMEMRRRRDAEFSANTRLWLEATFYIGRVEDSYRKIFGDRWYR